MEFLTYAIQFLVAAQYLFWGLNGFLHFKSLPASDPRIDLFVEKCFQIPLLMTTVKLMQIVASIGLFLNQIPLFWTAILFPITTVISVLHLIYNKKRYEVLLPLSMPYYILVILLLIKN